MLLIFQKKNRIIRIQFVDHEIRKIKMNLTTFQIKLERIKILQNKRKRYHIVYLFILLLRRTD